MDNLTVYNLPTAAGPRWDRLGIFYISFCCIWSTLVVAGMVFCWFNRHTPVMKIRGMLLSFTAISFLHAYWILAQITYPIAATIPIVLAYDIQYFFMGIWFPLGIALFHASNCRFLHIAKLQKQFTYPTLQRRADGCNGQKTSFLCRLRNISYSYRIMIFIGIGMVAQVLLTVGMWLACKKYHPTYGIPGTEMHSKTLPEQIIELGRGWEWWPSVLWQFIWTWIVAPILLWRAWSIRDTMGWRTQTIGCCISNLHATPMFLIASYVPVFDKINAYWSPSEWIHLSIMMFEIFTVFIPVYEIIRHHAIKRKAVSANSRWETASQTSTLNSATQDYKVFALNMAEKGKSVESLDEEFGDRLITMKALEHILQENPGPLLEFSALSDFSGENIAFLNYVARWKAANADQESVGENIDAYRSALQIYLDFVGPRDAQFPLNLPSQKLKQLEIVFEDSARDVRGEATTDPATPFDFGFPEHATPSTSAVDAEKFVGKIPFGFDKQIFNDAEDHIKYLVLTNTWPRFVADMQSRRRSIDSNRTDATDDSKASFSSQMSDRVKALLRSIF